MYPGRKHGAADKEENGMAYFKIITDTASDITKGQAEQMGVIMVPLSI